MVVNWLAAEALRPQTATKKSQDTCQPLPPNGRSEQVQRHHLLSDLDLECIRSSLKSLCGCPCSQAIRDFTGVPNPAYDTGEYVAINRPAAQVATQVGRTTRDLFCNCAET